jgi:hypothetical protein
MKSALIALAFFLVSSAGVVLAADQAHGSDPRSACKDDVEKLCPGVQPGGGRIVACLKQNEAQLSAACKDAAAKARQRKAPGGAAAPQG